VSALGHSRLSALGHSYQCPYWDTQQCPHWDTAHCPNWDTQLPVSILGHTAMSSLGHSRLCALGHTVTSVRTGTHSSVRTVSRVSVLVTKLAKCPNWDTVNRASELGHTAVSALGHTASALEHTGPKLCTAGYDIILTHSFHSLQEQYGVVVRLRHSTPYKGVPMSSDIFNPLPPNQTIEGCDSVFTQAEVCMTSQERPPLTLSRCLP
jgi:hypothetical protein